MFTLIYTLILKNRKMRSFSLPYYTSIMSRDNNQPFGTIYLSLRDPNIKELEFYLSATVRLIANFRSNIICFIETCSKHNLYLLFFNIVFKISSANSFNFPTNLSTRKVKEFRIKTQFSDFGLLTLIKLLDALEHFTKDNIIFFFR